MTEMGYEELSQHNFAFARDSRIESGKKGLLNNQSELEDEFTALGLEQSPPIKVMNLHERKQRDDVENSLQDCKANTDKKLNQDSVLDDLDDLF